MTSCTVRLWVWHKHIAGNVLYEMVYVIMDQATKVGARIAEFWALVQEANKLDDATTRIGTLTKSMFVETGAPHKHYPMLRCNAKDAEWFCKALALCGHSLRLNRPCPQGHLPDIGLVLNLYDIAGAHTGLFHVPENNKPIF